MKKVILGALALAAFALPAEAHYRGRAVYGHVHGGRHHHHPRTHRHNHCHFHRNFGYSHCHRHAHGGPGRGHHGRPFGHAVPLYTPGIGINLIFD